MEARRDPVASEVALAPDDLATSATLEAWLARDVHAADGPLRRSMGGLAVPPSAGLRARGVRVLSALTAADASHDGLLEGLDALHGYPDDLLIHAVQLLGRRARAAAAERGGPRQEQLVADRIDEVLRVLLMSRLARMRDALPRDGHDFLELAAVVRDTLYSTLASGLVRYVSPGIEELTGHPPEAFVSDSHLWARLVVAEDRATMERLFHQVLVSGEPMEAVYRIGHADGERVRHVLDRATPVVTEGRVVRIDGILIDITERIELELRVERSEQLRSLGQLARDVAHDFNNLLVSIIGHADLLLARMPTGSRDAHALRLIGAAADKGSKLTERLLAFARGASTSGAKQPVQLERLAHDATELARPSLPAGLRLEMSVSAGVPSVLADEARIGEAVLNLVLNAIQACSSGRGSQIDVAVRPATAPEAARIGAREATVLAVMDNGPGMTPEVRARVFEPMFTTRSREGGTGLGCAMAYGVAVDHGGVLEVESTPGAGATFRMLLPAGTEPAAQLTPSRPVETAPPPTLSARASDSAPRILVVDDEPSVRQLLKDLLEGAGFVVQTAASGQEAIDRVGVGPGTVDLVILDVMMHPVDGTAAFESLRATHPTLPIIFCTGHSDATRIAVPAALERAPIVQKPFRVAQLIRAVRQALAPA